MPYSIDRKNKCVYKKKSDGSRGEKVGCTKGDLQSYVSAIHANVDEKKKMLAEIKQALVENEEAIVEAPVQIANMIEFYVVHKAKDPMASPEKLVQKTDPISFSSKLREGLMGEDIQGFYISEEEAHAAAQNEVNTVYEMARNLEAKKNTVTEKLQKRIDAMQKEVDGHLKAAKGDPENADAHQTKAEEVLSRIREYRAKHGVVEKAKKPLEEKEKEDKKKLSEASLNIDFTENDWSESIALKIVNALRKAGYDNDKIRLIAKAMSQMPSLRENKKLNEDHEVSMAQNSLKAIISSASELLNLLGNEEKDIPAWIQDHITNAENYIEQASQNYHEYGPEHNKVLPEATKKPTGITKGSKIKHKGQDYEVTKNYDTTAKKIQAKNVKTGKIETVPLAEEKADKDYDGDGKIEKPEEEYKGVKDKAIKQATGKQIKEDALGDKMKKMSDAQLQKIVKQAEDEKVSGAFAAQVKAARAELAKRKKK